MAENNDKAEKNPENPPSFGFDMYPERRSGRAKPTLKELITKGHTSKINKTTCEVNVRKVFSEHPLVKILAGALRSAGCPIDLKRHIVCEECDSKVQGGFDAEFNQVVICKNVAQARDNPEVVLIHELIHMYDYCVNELDFKNLEHLACTEIRAANLSHCSFISSFLMGQSRFNDIKKTHKDCVKMRATYSLVVSRNLDFSEALNIVLKVFDKCYNDLEPIGRRIRRNSEDPFMAYEEGKCFKIFD